MNKFLFWCRHPLVPLLFQDVTSLYPLHLREMIFPLVPHTVPESYASCVQFFVGALVSLGNKTRMAWCVCATKRRVSNRQ